MAIKGCDEILVTRRVAEAMEGAFKTLGIVDVCLTTVGNGTF